MSATPTELPSRAATGLTTASTNDGAFSDTDPTSTAGLLSERLQAWKHAVGYLEDYMGAIEKIHRAQAKEYERALKTISNPLKEGHHFDQSLGGIAGYFENMRSNTQALINTNIETEKSIKGSVLPVLDRLHKEIKAKSKELTSGVEKTAKEVEKARNNTQKHIELLGQQTASYESSGGKIHGSDDPYVVNRGVLHRLHKQSRVIQQAMESFNLLAGGQGEKTRALHYDMLQSIQSVVPDFEWRGFTTRSADRLINPNDPARSVDDIQFPNMSHPATKPLIEGSLERKSRNKLSWGYTTGYYVVTPSKFLHEFKDSDNARVDPKPELSIYLPDAIIGAPSGEKFNVKGKDRSGGMSAKLTGTAELAFKAHTPSDAQRWFDIIRGVAGATGPAEPTSPSSPVVDQDAKFAAVTPPGPASPVAGHEAQQSGVLAAPDEKPPVQAAPAQAAPAQAAPAAAPAPEKAGAAPPAF
ncbi:PH domain-containing protein [Verticillium dahliae VdLs.17]|uniref:PH domain-containing protein n=1 Tax=Verticillium dahliae (strain VdLs.17 / ATCC MYA-4575 / FGSC 10137) TaxID=498257 RepID=G2X5Q1_VERDV|nr:PH domain-containing protein [Verticillium dahliae VdLs.17]EGY14392.1 PH domain-containing protein [Verticillium dahliae VdLs.17]